MIIQHNMMAANASRQLKFSSNIACDRQEKLSTGYQINRAADDAAGLAISEKMCRQIRGLDRTLDNIQDGISLIQTADGALKETHAILQRMNELAVQSANGTNSRSDRRAIQDEVDLLITEIDRIAYTTEIFNVKPLLGDATVTDTSYSMPKNTLFALKDVVDTSGTGAIGFMAEGMSYALAGIPFSVKGVQPLISVRDAGGHQTGWVKLTYDAHMTYTHAPGKIVSSYRNGNIAFDMELTWKKINCSTEDISREYFEFGYNFVNRSSADLTFDFYFQMDMLVGPKSEAIPDFDGKSTVYPYKWTGSSIPNEMTIDNKVGLLGIDTSVNLSAQYKWDGIANAPDIVLSGNSSPLQDVNMAFNPSISGDLKDRYPVKGDYFYSMGWSQRKVGSGEQLLMQSRIGLYAKKDSEYSYYHFKGNPSVWIQTGCDAGVGMMLDICNATAKNLGVSDFRHELGKRGYGFHQNDRQSNQ